jgi:tyrosinase
MPLLSWGMYTHDVASHPVHADMVSQTSSERPPELVAATEKPVDLVGDTVSVTLPVPSSTRDVLQTAVDAAGARPIYLNVEDLEAERNPGVIYGVYLNMRPGDSEADRFEHHVGNIAPFGIEQVTDRAHDGASGSRHTFEVGSRVDSLRKAGKWDPTAVTVTFELITPLPPPGQEDLMDSIVSEQREFAARTRLRVGRVSLFVG